MEFSDTYVRRTGEREVFFLYDMIKHKIQENGLVSREENKFARKHVPKYSRTRIHTIWRSQTGPEFIKLRPNPPEDGTEQNIVVWSYLSTSILPTCHSTRAQTN